MIFESKNTAELRSVIDKCYRLYDCYRIPPTVEGTQLTRAYLESVLYTDDKGINLRDDIAGGVFGDLARQMIHILIKNNQIANDTIVEFENKEYTYEQFMKKTPHRCPDMAIADSVDDPDADCFRGRKHLLDTFWEGCIEQPNPGDWECDDD